jgi:hypothetical protein
MSLDAIYDFMSSIHVSAFGSNSKFFRHCIALSVSIGGTQSSFTIPFFQRSFKPVKECAPYNKVHTGIQLYSNNSELNGIAFQQEFHFA